MRTHRQVIDELKEPTRSLQQAAVADQVAEALGLALLMDGGTASVRRPRRIDTLVRAHRTIEETP